jgi:hypothetical protein
MGETHELMNVRAIGTELCVVFSSAYVLRNYEIMAKPVSFG